MDAQKYLDGHWGTGEIAHSQMIQFMEEYADIKLAEWKAKNLPELLADFVKWQRKYEYSNFIDCFSYKTYLKGKQ